MSLNDLVPHIPHQEEKIDQLVKSQGRFFSHGSLLDAWVPFRESLWGQKFQSEEVVQEDGTVDTIVTFPETIPIVLSGYTSRILVRAEYEETERAALSANASRVQAFLVTGQPGIGKTSFLIWLLMQRLSLELPTVLQIEPTYAILFHKDGVLGFQSLDTIIYEGLEFEPGNAGRIWALIDTDGPLVGPAPIFCEQTPFFVVETASPCSKRFEWARKITHQVFYVKPWTFSEVLRARQLIGLQNGGPWTEDQLRYLYDTYGASPGALSNYADNPGHYEQMITMQVQMMSLQSLRDALRSPECNKSSHLLVVTEPSPTSRELSQERIASRPIFEIIWNHLMKYQVGESLSFYNLLKSTPDFGVAAGWIFEFRMHQLLRRGNSITLFPIGGKKARANFTWDHYTTKNSMHLQLTPSHEYPLDEETKLIAGHYYRPRAGNYPTIDSLLLVSRPKEPPILLMFQITRDKGEHRVSKDGLDKVAAFRLPRRTRKYYVIVTPHDRQPNITAPMSHWEGEDPGQVFPVFHYPVNEDTIFGKYD